MHPRFASRSLSLAPVILVATAASSGQPIPIPAECDEDDKYGVVNPPYICSSNLEWPSICWSVMAACKDLPEPTNPYPPTGIPPATTQFDGFPLNLDMTVGATPGDYPARELDILKSSSCFVPADYDNIRRGPNQFERSSALSKSVDLVTGAPMLQATDFELPFGGATFRHVRTYSEHPAPGDFEHTCAGPTFLQPSDAYWDWQGQGWMMGEAPILLFHANHLSMTSHLHTSTSASAGYGLAIPDDPNTPQNETRYFDEPPRINLVLDAHHTIPFIAQKQVSGPPKYVAPTQFDAKLTCTGGTWDSTAFDWTNLPDEITVWLHDGTVKHTFKIMAGDVFAEGTWHGRSLGPKYTGPYGLPYWARLERIEDRFGNKVLIDYCDFRQFDPPDTEGNNTPVNDCLPCHQNCNERGMPSRVQLSTRNPSNGQDEIQWTIFYTYRAFWWEDNPWSATTYSYGLHQQNAIHEIYVYDGDREYPTAIAGDKCMTLSPELFEYDSEMTARESLQHVDAVDALEVFDLPLDWSLRSKYTYSNDDADIAEYVKVFGAACPNPSNSPRLLKVGTTRESLTNHAEKKTEYSIYRYKETPSWVATPNGNDHASMYLVFGPEAVARILNTYRLQEANPIDMWPVPSELIDVYSLLLWPENQEIALRDPETNQVLDPKPLLRQTADIQLYGWDQTLKLPGGGTGPVVGEATEITLSSNTFMSQLLANGSGDPKYLDGIAGNRLLFLPTGAFLGVNTEGGEQRVHRFYRFLVYPGAGGAIQSWDDHPSAQFESMPSGHSCYNYISGFPTLLRALYHHPFRVATIDYGDFDDELRAPKQSDLTQPFWITVIDTYEDFDQAFLNDDTINLPAAHQPDSRRVVQMNAKGFVIKEKIWNKDGGVISTEGVTESYTYDAWGRLTARHSKGWGVAEVHGDPETEGRIDVLWYDDPSGLPTPDPWKPDPAVPLQAAATGVKSGTLGTVHWLTRQHSFEDGDWDVERSAAYVVDETSTTPPAPPTTGAPPASGMIWTETRYHLAGSSMTPRGERARDRKVSIKPGSPSRDGGSALYGVDREVYDEKGRMVARGYGMLADSTGLSSTGSDDRFYWDTAVFDEQGRPTTETIDDPTYEDSLATNLDRKDDGDPLEYVKTYTYYPAGHWAPGLESIIYPNGRRQYVMYNSLSSGADHYEQRIYQDVVQVGTDWKCLQPVLVNDIALGQVVRSRSVNITLDGVPDGTEAFTTGDVISTLLPVYDSSGRIVQASRVGSDGTAVGSLIEMDGFENVIRQIDADQTITRSEYDHLGMLRRVWRGTDDSGDYWDTGSISDNMVPLQKYTYGMGTTDAGIKNVHELIKTRTLRDQPSDRYESSSNEDSLGWVEEYGYDWRMRQVVVARRNKAGTIISHSVTYLDQHSRVCMVAEYGGTIPSSASLDPQKFEHDDPIPTASALLTASPVPLRLTESLYHPSGQASEVRFYDVSSGLSADYTVSKTFYDYRDRVTYSIRPSAGTEQSSFDALGRRHRALSAVVPSSGTPTELLLVETLHDADGNALEVKRHERFDDGSLTGTLVPVGQTGPNSIMTRTFNWYDQKNRVIATAEIGANSSTVYGNTASTPPTRTTNPPISFTSGVLTGISTITNAPHAQVTAYQYDNEGRLTRIIHPNGSLTLNKYDDLGQLVLSIENAALTGSQTTALDRVATGYKYENGRLTLMATIKDFADLDTWDALGFSNGDAQVTKVEYGAPIVYETETNTEPLSLNNSYISKLYLPHPTSGKPETLAFEYKYYPDGKLAERKDARGIKIKHKYDEWGRLTEVLVDQAAWKATFPTNWRHPADQMERITYTYDALGRLTLVNTAWFNAHPSVNSWQTITENKLHYDARGNLLKEEQEHGGAVNGSTKHIEYAWAYCKANGSLNYDRLTTMTYPDRNQNAGVQRRVVSFDYGTSADHPSSLLSRISKISDALSTAPSTVTIRATYDFMGLRRRVAEVLGPNSAGTNWAARWLADSDSTVTNGFERLDPMARMKDLHFQTPSSGATIHQYQYTYDLANNLRTAKVKQAASGGTWTDNRRSYGYAFDNLNRLVKAEMGELNGSLVIVAPSGGEIRKTGWGLDQLGNWVGASSPLPTVGRLVEGLDGNPSTIDTLSTDHTVDEVNKLTQTTTIVNGGSPVGVTHTFDANGNLVCDGVYYYEYDAFNRLLRVRQLGSLTFSGSGIPQANNAGPWIVHYAYDGVSRIARRQAPWPQPGASVTKKRMEHYYYDGARRIQEVFTDPYQAAEEEAESMADENASQTEASVMYTNREYIYGTGDRHGLDEIVCQLTSLNVPAYIMQDVSGNVMGLLEADGDVIEQYTYDPYGELVASESFLSYGVNRLGHKGLFFDRLDGAVASSQMVPSAVGHYHNRNRMYAPRFGRWLQRDPKETGQIVAASAMMGAIAQSAAGEWADLDGIYGDGMSLYNYLGNNPLTHSDPLGLSWDPFDLLVDDFLAENAGSQAAFMERLSGGFNSALHIGLQIAQLHPAVGMAVAAYNIANGKGDVWDVLEVAGGPATAIIGKALGSYSKVRRAYEATGKTCRRLDKPANSFVEGTMVMTVVGERPIEELRPGDLVLTRPESDPCAEPMFRPILEVIVGEAKLIVWITTEDGRTIGMTSDHEVWVESERGREVWENEVETDLVGGWIAASDLQVGDELRGPASALIVGSLERASIIMVRFEPHIAPVYNLAVEDGRTYFANGLWVHNCGSVDFGGYVLSIGGKALRPPGVPKHWIEKAADKNGGIIYFDPKVKSGNHQVRSMPGTPDAKYPHQRQPYVKYQKDGQFFDKNGNVVPDATPDSHISFFEFTGVKP